MSNGLLITWLIAIVLLWIGATVSIVFYIRRKKGASKRGKTAPRK